MPYQAAIPYSIVIPARHEADTIGAVLGSVIVKITTYLRNL